MVRLMKSLFLGIFLIVAASAVLLVSDYRGRVQNMSGTPGGSASNGLAADGPAAALHGKVRAGSPVRVAVLKWTASVTTDETYEGLVAGLAERGFEHGKNVTLEKFSAEGDMPTAVSMAQNACGGDYDLMLTISTPMLQVGATANKEGKVVHVFGAVTDPYAAGVGISRENHREHPAWLTGVGTFQPVREALELTKRLYPDLTRIGTVMNPSEACSQACYELAKKTCAELGVELVAVTVDNSSAVYEAASALTSQGVQAFAIGGDNSVESAFDSVVRAADAAGIPVVGYASMYAEKGALFGLGANYVEVGRIQAQVAADILGGASPADIPVENVMPLKLSLNKNVLKKLRDLWRIPPEVEAQAAIIVDESGTRHLSQEVPAPLGVPKAGAGAAPGARRWNLHYLNYVDSAPQEETLRGFLKALRDEGWTEGKEYTLTVSNAQGDMPTLAAMVDNVLTQNADMLVLTSTPTLQTAVKKVRDIPVIFGVVANPVLAGAGTSDTDHLPNVTGISSASAYDEGAAALLACLPGAKRVGTLVNPSESNCVYNFEQLKAVFAAKGVELVSVPVSTPTEIPDGVRALLSMNVDAVLQVAGNLFFSSFAPISKACLEAKTPLFGFDTATAVKGGAAVAVARDYVAGGEDMGRVALRVLRGEKPAAIPFSPISRTIVTINEKNAARYGLDIPASLRQRANIVSGE